MTVEMTIALVAIGMLVGMALMAVLMAVLASGAQADLRDEVACAKARAQRWEEMYEEAAAEARFAKRQVVELRERYRWMMPWWDVVMRCAELDVQAQKLRLKDPVNQQLAQRHIRGLREAANGRDEPEYWLKDEIRKAAMTMLRHGDLVIEQREEAAV